MIEQFSVFVSKRLTLVDSFKGSGGEVEITRSREKYSQQQEQISVLILFADSLPLPHPRAYCENSTG